MSTFFWFFCGEEVYWDIMPNQRAPGQKLLPIAVDEKFLRELDAGLEKAGYRNRSQFIRDAIVEKLLRANIPLSRDLALPPHRIGKTRKAPARTRYPAHNPSDYALNEKADSTRGKTARRKSAR